MSGCLRPLAIGFGVLVAFGVGIFFWYGDTSRLMVDNARALAEGADEAETLAAPGDLAAYLSAREHAASVLVVDLDGDAPRIAFHSDRPRPAPGLTPWLLLADFLSRPPPPADSASIPYVERYRLPSAGAAPTASPPAALEPLLGHAWRKHDPAAADVLLDRLGPTGSATFASRFGLTATDAPIPRAGLFLTWSRHTLSTPADERLALLRSLDRPALSDSAWTQLRRYVSDQAFRDAERARRNTRGADLSLDDQRAFASATWPRTTAADWAHLIARLVETTGSVETLAETVGAGASDVGPFETVLVRSAAFPGHYTVAGVAQGADGGTARIAVLMLEQLPLAVFYRLSRTGLADALVLDLLAGAAWPTTPTSSSAAMRPAAQKIALRLAPGTGLR